MPFQLIDAETGPAGPVRDTARQAGDDMGPYLLEQAPLLAADCLEIIAAGHWSRYPDHPLHALCDDIQGDGATIEAATEHAKGHILTRLYIAPI